MKLFVTKYNNEKRAHEALVLPNTDYRNPKFVEVDFFVGCCFSIPEGYTEEEVINVWERMVGNIYEIKDDTHFSSGVYLPSEKDLILK